MVDLGNRIRTLRKNNGLSQKQLAEKLGLTKSVVSAYENEIRSPSLDVLVSLSRIFKVSTDYLLGQSKEESDLIEAQTQYADLTGLSEEKKDIVRNLVRVLRE